MTNLATLPQIVNAKVGAGVTVAVPKGDYCLPAMLILRCNLSIAAGSTLDYTGSGEPFLLAEPGITLDGNGLTCEKCPTFFVMANQPNCRAENFVLGMNPATPAGSIGGGACPQRGATNFICTNFTVGVVDEYPAFAQEDGFQAVNWDVCGSLHQASFRGDNDGVSKNPNGTFRTPIGLVISGGTWRKVAANCQTIEARQAYLTVRNGAIIIGDVVTGQGTQRTSAPPTPVQPFQVGENGTVVFEDCTLQDITPGNAGVGVRFGSIFQYSKSQTKFVSSLPLSQIVVNGGGIIKEAA